MRANFRLQRLYVDDDLSSRLTLELNREHSNYLASVLRLKEGAELLIFNGRDGEWLCELEINGRKKASLFLKNQVRRQPITPSLMVMFAPIKVGRLEYMVQKMTEMGAGIIQPVFTDHTQLHKINEKRLEANIIEAAEQCGVLSIPELRVPQKFMKLINQWDENRHLIFCDEGHETNNPLSILQELDGKDIAILIGPEGGFSEPERNVLNEKKYVSSIPLGPRILRADTALVAAISIVQATIGDWN